MADQAKQPKKDLRYQQPTTREEQLHSDIDLADQPPAGQGGRAGGEMNRDIGSRDEEKRAFERPAGATRVTKSDEKPKEDRNFSEQEEYMDEDKPDPKDKAAARYHERSDEA